MGRSLRDGDAMRRAAHLVRQGRTRLRIPVRGAPTAPSRADDWSVCYAPHASMYFDQHGKVRACCQNTGVYLGNVTQMSLRDIWESAEADRLRAALEAGDYSQGCEFCGWESDHLGGQVLFARGFDHLRPAERRIRWPRHMEFSLTNTCNLQCVMCDGDLSSAIRRHREHRPALPSVYGDRFFEELTEFLPHLEAAKFLGGEPFLGSESLRVLDMLVESRSTTEVTVITNGTIRSPRVERILAELHPRLIVSIDGASPETYGAVRVGASIEQVIDNLDRFREAVGSDRVSITTCLMRSNWHEFADVLRLAEDRGVYAAVNVVRFPESESLYALPADELAQILVAMRRTRVRLTRSRQRMWIQHLTGLEHHLDRIRPAAG